MRHLSHEVGTGAVMAVVAHAHPAELVAAGEANHGHTAIVLFDRRLALRTRLGVQRHPHLVNVHALSLLKPAPLHITSGRLVSLALAIETEGIATLTSDIVFVKGS